MIQRKQSPASCEKPPRILIGLGSKDARLQTILGLAKERGWSLRLLEWSPLDAEDPPDGALIHDLPTGPLARELRSMGCPAVRLGSFVHPDDKLLPAVLPDLAAAGRLGAEHFAKRQYQSIAFVGFMTESSEAQFFPLFNGFRRRAGELGMTCKYHSTRYKGVEEDSWQERRKRREKAYLELVAGLPSPIGVFTITDGNAVRICEACHKVGVKIPEEVSVLGYGNNIQCEMVELPLSSIDPGREQNCKAGMELLAELMAGAPPPAKPVMVPPARLIERQSTDVLAATDPIVRQALRFMWSRLDKDLSVADIAREVGVSRTTLQRRVSDDIGRGVAAELRRKRLERVCELLCASELTITEIAVKTGFRTSGYLHRVFRSEHNITPGAYRRQNRNE